MDKKSVIALVLIAVIILLIPYYQQWITPPGSSQRVTEERIATPDSLKSEEKVTVKEEKSDTAYPVPDEKKENISLLIMEQDSIEKHIEINTEKIHVRLSNLGGGKLEEFILKKYTMYDSSYVNMIDDEINNQLTLNFYDLKGNYIRTSDYLFRINRDMGEVIDINKDEQFEISYSLHFENAVLKKTFIFYGSQYHFDLKIQFEKASKLLLNDNYEIVWENGLPATESYASDDNSYNQLYIYIGGELESYSRTDAGKGELTTLSGNADWLAVRTKYFMTSLINVNADVSEGVFYVGQGIEKQDYIQRLYDFGYKAQYGKNNDGDVVRVYIGPMDHRELEKYEKDLDLLIMNNGWYERTFRFISYLILPILDFLYKFIPNYGVVIIIFSLIVKILVYPLTKKSYQSMKEMQNIQPIMSELREKYKSDPQRLNKEMMKLYKEHGVNPLGGCLPMLLQMPLLIALFIVFRSTIQLRGATFIPGWIDDLSRADTLFHLPFSIPLYGNEFNLLPILMAVTMIFQSKMTMQDPKQKAMVYMMPIFMLLIFNRFPSGLNLYYTMFNIFTIIQQKFIKGTEPPKGKENKKNK